MKPHQQQNQAMNENFRSFVWDTNALKKPELSKKYNANISDQATCAFHFLQYFGYLSFSMWFDTYYILWALGPTSHWRIIMINN